MKSPYSLILAAALLITFPARAEPYHGELKGDGGIDINVRAGIDQAEKDKRDHDPAYAQNPNHARVFFLAHIQEEKNGETMVKPVDARALAQELTQQLEAQGFHPALPGQKPDIIITAKYGRGYLSNPYTNTDADKQHTSLSNTDVITQWPTHNHFVGLEEKAQRTAAEQLIIQVRAWEYPPPPDPKKKEKLLWVTTIHVDDPDHRDLNEIAAKMLATGAPYFDHHIDRESEVVVNTLLPEGHVNVGTPEVVTEPKSK